jgi:DNA-binding NarL/FixJ family response regulator
VITVVVVDDHRVVRAGLEQLLSTVADFDVVGVASDGAEAMDVIAKHQPDVVLMDLSMPNIDGVAATELLREHYPECKVLVLTSFGDQNLILDALAAGAEGYLFKDSQPDQIIAAIRVVNDGGSPLDPKVAHVMLNARRVRSLADGLSRRELEVLHLVRDGLANRAIAKYIGVSERTVKAHLTRIFQHLDVSDRTQAAVWAVHHLRAVEPR